MVVLMEYICIRAKKDVITENNNGINNGMKNSKEKRIQCKKWRSGEVLISLFIYLKKSNHQIILKNI